MCFNGRPRLIQVHRGRFGHHTQDFFSTDWTKMPFTQGDPESCCKIDRPENLDLMLELSSRLAEGIPQLRIDWFETKSGLKLGEMTFFDGSGFYPFEPEEWDAVLGSWITL